MNILSHLEDLNNYLGHLNDTINSFNDKRFDIDFYEIFRRTKLVELILLRQPIAVSGMQGVGKTTIIKSLIDIPSNTLPDAESFGEQIPVFITLGESKGISRIVYEIKEGRVIPELIDNPDSFKRMIRHKIDADRENKIICAELVINKKKQFVDLYSKGIRSFLLLPGFEETAGFLDVIVQQGLNAAPACVFVMTDEKFAQASNFSKCIALEKDYVKTKPIYILSHADQSSDKNRELKRQVIKRLNIPSSESSRVMISGVDVPEIEKKFRASFPDTIVKYNNGSDEIRYSLTVDIRELTNSINSKLLKEIRNQDYIAKFSDENLNKTKAIRNVIDAFELEVADLKRRYSQETFEALETTFNNVSEALKGQFLNRSFLKRLGTAFRSKEKIGEEILAGIKDELLYSNTNEDILNKRQYEVIDRICTSQIGRIIRDIKGDSSLVRSADRPVGAALIITDEQVNSDARNLAKELVDYLRYIYHYDSEFDDSIKKEPGKIKWVLKLIPYISLEYIKLGNIMIETYDSSTKHPEIPSDWDNLLKKSRTYTNQNPENADNKEDLSMIDLYKDDSVASVRMAASTLGLAIAKEEGNLELPNLIHGLEDGSVVTTIGAILMVTKKLQEIYRSLYNDQDKFNHRQISNILLSARQGIHHQSVSKFNSLMEEVRKILIGRLEVKFGISKNAGLVLLYNDFMNRVTEKTTEILNITNHVSSKRSSR